MERATIFDIKRFSIYDGPGIRTTIFFKGCSLNCEWCQNPEGINSGFELFYNENKCINCSRCVKACPVNKISSSIANRFEKNIKCLVNCSLCYENCSSEAIYKVGEYYTVEELVNLLIKDLDFYKISGGGITLSGGEPLLQINFLEKFFKKIKIHHINIVVETCGYTDWNDFTKILDDVDIFFYDLKIIDEKKHKEYVGYSNELVLNNLIKLSGLDKNLVLRVPMIPGITDTEDNLKDIIAFIKNNKLQKYKVEMLPFNNLANTKYNKTGINCVAIGNYNICKKMQSKDFLFSRKKILTDEGIKVKVLSLE